MKFFHFTSIARVKELESKGILEYSDSEDVLSLKVKSTLGYSPIFCMPILVNNPEDMLFRLVCGAPSYPQRLIIFETDTFDSIGYVSMSNVIRTAGDDELDITGSDKYLEYVVPRINNENVLKIIEISDETDMGTLSDHSLDRVFSYSMPRSMFRACGMSSNKYLKDVNLLSFEDRFRFLYFVDHMVDIASCTDEHVISEFREFVYNKLISERKSV